MNGLNDDILRHIFLQVSAKDLFNIASVSTGLYNILNDDFFKFVCYKLYGKLFWKRALQRPKYKHDRTWKDSLRKIERFQELVINLGEKRWGNESFLRLFENDIKF